MRASPCPPYLETARAAATHSGAAYKGEVRGAAALGRPRWPERQQIACKGPARRRRACKHARPHPPPPARVACATDNSPLPSCCISAHPSPCARPLPDHPSCRRLACHRARYKFSKTLRESGSGAAVMTAEGGGFPSFLERQRKRWTVYDDRKRIAMHVQLSRICWLKKERQGAGE